MTNYAEASLSNALRFLSDSQAAISNNIANSTTSGYKRKSPIAVGQQSEFQSMLGQSLPTLRYLESTNFTPGSERASTGMNVSLGEGQFFRVQDAYRAYYTRRGELVLDSQGYLVTPNGERFLGIDGQPVQVGEASEIRIASNGEVAAKSQGEDRVVGQLGVYRVDGSETRLSSVGRSLFVDRNVAAEPTPHPAPNVRQGYIEESNVDVLDELVSMIHVQRSFDATTRALQSVDRVLSSFAQAMSR